MERPTQVGCDAGSEGGVKFLQVDREFSFSKEWGWKSGPCTCQASSPPLSNTPCIIPLFKCKDTFGEISTSSNFVFAVSSCVSEPIHSVMITMEFSSKAFWELQNHSKAPGPVCLKCWEMKSASGGGKGVRYLTPLPTSRESRRA